RPADGRGLRRLNGRGRVEQLAEIVALEQRRGGGRGRGDGPFPLPGRGNHPPGTGRATHGPPPPGPGAPPEPGGGGTAKTYGHGFQPSPGPAPAGRLAGRRPLRCGSGRPPPAFSPVCAPGSTIT